MIRNIMYKTITSGKSRSRNWIIDRSKSRQRRNPKKEQDPENGSSR